MRTTIFVAFIVILAGCLGTAAPSEAPASQDPDPDPAVPAPSPEAPPAPAPEPDPDPGDEEEPTSTPPTNDPVAPRNGTLEGTVQDGGQGVPAQLEVAGHVDVAGADGRFRIQLPPGDHVVHAKYDGRNASQPVTIVAGQTTQVVLTLPAAPSRLANTHYFFLMNLNDVKCSTDLGHGDILIAQRLIDHAIGLGMPASNVHFYNEDGAALCRDDDPEHYDQLGPAYQNGSIFAGPATLAAFASGLTSATGQAVASEAAGGPPARIFIMQSSHGLLNPANLLGTGPIGNRVFSSFMGLHDGITTDVQLGDALGAAIDAQEHSGVDVETAVLIDCSFCGGFADSPFPYPGTTTTAVDSAGVVGPNRVVEVGCAWVTECFGNPAVTYDHIFNECMFQGVADGYGPAVDGTGVPHPLPGGDDDLGRDIILSDATHHGPDGATTLEEAYWCALDSVQQPIDIIGIQQMFQLVDQMDDDIVDDGFLLWAPDGIPMA